MRKMKLVTLCAALLFFATQTPLFATSPVVPDEELVTFCYMCFENTSNTPLYVEVTTTAALAEMHGDFYPKQFCVDTGEKVTARMYVIGKTNEDNCDPNTLAEAIVFYNLSTGEQAVSVSTEEKPFVHSTDIGRSDGIFYKLVITGKMLDGGAE